MKVGDVFVVYDARGEQGRVTITAIRSDHVVAEGCGGTRWVINGERLRSAKRDRFGNHADATPAGPWDERKRINAARTAVQDALSADRSGEMALFLADCVLAASGPPSSAACERVARRLGVAC